LKDKDYTQTSSSDSTYKRRKYNNQYSKKTLDEIKTELASILKENVEEKMSMRKEVFKVKLEKEKLKIELLKILIEKKKQKKNKRIRRKKNNFYTIS